MAAEKSPGQVAFEGYAEQAEGRSLVSGKALPAREMLPRDITDAWDAAAQAVITDYEQQHRQAGPPG